MKKNIADIGLIGELPKSPSGFIAAEGHARQQDLTTHFVRDFLLQDARIVSKSTFDYAGVGRNSY